MRKEKTKVRKMQKLAKNVKGITLIALVITIIVLLILAGVAISLTIGQNGIFTRAQFATEEYMHSNVKDAFIMKQEEYQIDKYNGTRLNLIEYLQSEVGGTILNSNNEINIEALLGSKQKLGNGSNHSDVYVVETDDQTNYVLRYYNENGEINDLLNFTVEASQILGKLADVVEVGDYVNYAPTYTNVSELEEGLRNGWRVAYVDESTEAVTLISEGVPLEYEKTNDLELNYDYETFFSLFDSSVANNIELFDLEDLEKLCEQANYELIHIEAIPNYPYHDSETYHINNDDNLKIISIGTEYIINTIGVNGYGSREYFINRGLEYHTLSRTFGSIRIIAELKTDLDYYGGDGSQTSPYQIY